MSKSENSFVSSLIYKFIERMSGQLVSFIVSIVLARLLLPEDYGTLALMTVFTLFAQIIVQKGINSALIQNKDVTEDDYSTVFWMTFAMSAVIYIALFLFAPMLESLYRVEDFVFPFRVMCLIIFLGAFNSIQVAKMSREMKFKSMMYRTLIATVISGVIGVIMAYQGFGIWALIVQQLASYVVSCVIMISTTKWYPRFVFSKVRIKILYSFGWKIMAANLFDTLYDDFVGMLIGLKYSAADLGLYNKGKKFPHLVMWSVESSINAVLLPTLARKQDDLNAVRSFVSKVVRYSVFLIFPLMLGMAAISQPMVRVILTDKWLGCEYYIIAFCIIYAIVPMDRACLQAYNAIGRSDVYLHITMLKKIILLPALAITLVFFNDPVSIVIGSVIMVPFSLLINFVSNKRYLNYGIKAQVTDILPGLLCSILVVVAVAPINLINAEPIILLAIEIPVGVIVYLVASMFLNKIIIVSIFNKTKSMFKKKKKKE